MKLQSLTGIAAAVLFAGVASAQSPAQPATPATPATPSTGSSSSMSGGGFDKLDKDKDGSISKKEAASNKDLTKKWDTLDANKDGKLDSGEFAQFEVEGSTSGSTGSGATAPDSSKSEKPKF